MKLNGLKELCFTKNVINEMYLVFGENFLRKALGIFVASSAR